jgi:hypothetical protein
MGVCTRPGKLDGADESLFFLPSVVPRTLDPDVIQSVLEKEPVLDGFTDRTVQVKSCVAILLAQG